MIPSEAIRDIYDKRREAQDRGFEPDEYDLLFGKASTLEKATIEYLDKEDFYKKLDKKL